MGSERGRRSTSSESRRAGGSRSRGVGAISSALPLADGANGAGALAHPFSASAWVRNFASQDWLTIGYFVILLVALCAGRGPHRSQCLERVSADFVIFLLCLALVRGGMLRWGGAASALVYRTVFIVSLLSSFSSCARSSRR